LCPADAGPILLAMRAFRSRPADGAPAVRVCDADRDRVIAELRERAADGSLAHESFVFRVDAALRARYRGDLAEIVSDRAYMLEKGQIRWAGTMTDLVEDAEIQRSYLTL